MRRPSRSAIISATVTALLVALFGLLAAIGSGATTLGGCGRCHSESEFVEATAASGHASLSCNQCHGGSNPGSRLAFARSQALGMWLPVVEVDPTVASVPSSTCTGCHDSAFSAVTEASGLRISHLDCAGELECTDCHSTTAHGAAVTWPRTASMELCIDCHVERSAPTECDVCHAARLPSDRVKDSSFAVTHGPDYEKTHGMGNMSTCVACHEPGKCAGCHGSGVPHVVGFIEQHAAQARVPGARCTSCHVERFCSDCHGYEMPHPKNFVVGHAATVEADGELGCRRCHADPDCDECHIKHAHPTTREQLRILGVPVPDGDLE